MSKARWVTAGWHERRGKDEFRWPAAAQQTENLPLPSVFLTMIHEEFTETEEIWPEPVYEDFDYETDAEPEPLPAAEEPHVPMREQFPAAGSDYMGGSSDGWEYRSVFAGSKLAATYEMVRRFLQEEGYDDVPLPASADDLRLFKRPRNAQLQLFGERGYIHNPVKILFPYPPAPRNALLLCVYNERLEGHLLRFHGVAR